MPGVKEIIAFVTANKAAVLRWQEAIAHEMIFPQVRAEIEAVPPILSYRRTSVNGQLYTYAVLCAMGYGAVWAREIIMVQLIIDRLET
jgi:hypothetical protein